MQYAGAPWDLFPLVRKDGIAWTLCIVWDGWMISSDSTEQIDRDVSP